MVSKIQNSRMPMAKVRRANKTKAKRAMSIAHTAYNCLGLIAIGFVFALAWVTFNPSIPAQVYGFASVACDQVVSRYPKEFYERFDDFRSNE